MQVRPASADDRVGIHTVLDAGLLEIETTTLQTAISDGRVLVALEPRTGDADGPILGALVVADDSVVAVAVRPGRRGQGIGTTLVEAALEEYGDLEASFDERVRPFWEALGITIETRDGDRYRGTLCADSTPS